MACTIQLQNVPAPHEVHIALYNNVTNATTLRDKLLAGDEAFEYAFIDATTIVSSAHVLAAVQTSVHSLLVAKKLRTRNVHSEIVFNLSPTNNISEAFRRFGVSCDTKSLLCIKVSTGEKPFQKADVEQHLAQSVEGDLQSFSQEILAGITDWKKVSKYYKVSKGIDQKTQTPINLADLELEILGKMVMRAVG